MADQHSCAPRGREQRKGTKGSIIPQAGNLRHMQSRLQFCCYFQKCKLFQQKPNLCMSRIGMNGLAFQTLQDQVKIVQASHSYSKVAFSIQRLPSQTEHCLLWKVPGVPVLLRGAFWGWLRKEKIGKQRCVYPDTHQALVIQCVTCTDWPGTPPAIVWKSSPDYSPTMALFGWNCRYLCWAFSFSTVPWLVLFNWVPLN